MIGQIVIDHVSKSYFLFGNELKRVFSWFGLPFKPIKQINVLSNINFKIGAGESIGIIGQNGAGKSTLLKIITGTTFPTQGQVHISGKVAAILELGMGFNPEFTGRQNAYHVATLMGYSRQEIDQVIQKIKDFSEVGEYFEQPVRTYSSGMQMRVAFSVATAFRPDFLIVDEALAVGDIYFQHKSYAKIREFKSLGTTILFVSHDRNAVVNICDRAILLEKGRMIFDGPVGEAMDHYNALIAEKEKTSVQKVSGTDGINQTKSGTGDVKISGVSLTGNDNRPLDSVSIGQPIKINVSIIANTSVDDVTIGYSIRDKFGQIMFGTNSHLQGQKIGPLTTGQNKSVSFSFINNLGIGVYYITIGAHGGENHLGANYDWIDNCCTFEVINSGHKFQGCVYLQNKVEILN